VWKAYVRGRQQIKFPSGQNKELCPEITTEIIRKAIKSLHGKDDARDKRAAVKSQIVGASGVGGSESGSSASHSTPTRPNPSAFSSFLVPRTTPSAQPGIKSAPKEKEKEEAYKLVSKCLLWSDVLFQIAKTNPFYQPMFDVVVVVGPGYKAPTFVELRGPLLQNEMVDCTARLEEFRASWEHTGCTVMSNGSTNEKDMTLLNFLVSHPKGTMFMKFANASAQIKDARLLCELLDTFI